jgi:putative ABC transport system permease protein
MTGLPADSELLHRHRLLSGRYVAEGAGEILLGELASKDLGLIEGDNLRVDPSTQKVVGIYQTGIRVIDKGAILSMTDIQRLRKIKNVNLIVLDLKDPTADIIPVMKKISKGYPDLEPLRSSEVLNSFDQVKILRNISLAVSLIAFVIAVVGILNTMVISVYERTQEIGILRALGWSKGMVMAMIFREGVLISLVGGVSGFGLGVLGTELGIRTIDIGLIDAYYPFSILLLGLLLSVVSGVIGSSIPAMKAMRISPLEALRHE